MARKFTFRFQQLLDIANFEEKEVKNRLSEKNRQINELDEKIQKYIDDYENALSQQEADMRAGEFNKLRFYPAYLTTLKKSQTFYEKEKALQIKQRDKIMEELLDKQRRRKTYEILKDKDYESYKKLALKAEQKMLDEFNGRKKISEDTEE